MSELPRVSVIVRTADRPDLLRLCLRSLLRQDYPVENLELIVVDAGRTATAEIVLQSLSRFVENRTVRVVRSNPDEGLSEFRNIGIKHSTGSIVAFVDHDEIAPPQLISTLVLTLQANPWASAAGGRYIGILRGHRALTLWCGKESIGSWEPAPPEAGIQEVDDLPGGNVAIRRSAFERYGYFDSRVRGAGDDRAWFTRARAQGARFVYNPYAFVYHLRQVEDLQGMRFLQRCWAYGWSLGRAARLSGEELAPTQIMWALVCNLAHGVLRKCRFGFGNALAEVAKIIGFLSSRPAK